MTQQTPDIRYLVIKLSDLHAALSIPEIRQLGILCDKIQAHRHKTKQPLECLVVEKDWPEYQPTWDAIIARVINSTKTDVVKQNPDTVTHRPDA